jgi:iron complex outermembrane receptor protein
VREVTLGVAGTNLLNDDMRNHASFKKDEVLLPGRNVRFYTTVRF